MSVEIERGETLVNGWRVQHWAAGSGGSLLLLHGLGGSSNWWLYNLANLAQHRRVYALDLLARDETGRRAYFRFLHAPRLLRDWLAARGLARADLLGHSMGGHIALRLAARFPELVDRLIVVDASGVPQRVPLPLLAWRASRAGGRQSPLFAPGFLQRALHTGLLLHWQTVREVLTHDARPELAGVQAPTLILWGAHDQLIPVRCAQALKAGIPHAELHIVPDAGHNLPTDQPETFARLVNRFLAQPRPLDRAAS